jgi:hypothetical protein
MKTPIQIFSILLITATCLCLTFDASAQKTSASKTKKASKSKTVKDSIFLNNIVTFDKSAFSITNKAPNYANVVKFTLKITNGSKGSIPDPIAYKGAKYVKFYINGRLANPKTLFDESEDTADTDNVIRPDSTQTFYCDWLSSKNAGFQKKYGKKFTIQWSYLNILSKKVAVDMTKRTSRTIN